MSKKNFKEFADKAEEFAEKIADKIGEAAEDIAEKFDEAMEEDFCEDDVLEEQEEQEDDQNTKYLRLMADFQNYKRRSEKEKSDVYAYANEKLLGELLSVLDNFERALEHEADAAGSFSEGMSMIFKNFKDVLEKAGLEEIEALGQEFDPNIHNAVMTDANSDYESGMVCDVVQKGYKLKDRVVRPSMVKVAE